METLFIVIAAVALYLVAALFTTTLAVRVDDHFSKYEHNDFIIYGVAGLFWPLALGVILIGLFCYMMGKLAKRMTH